MAKQETQSSKTPVLDAFRNHGFGLAALVLSDKKSQDRTTNTQTGRYVAILDTNYQFPGTVCSELFAEARQEVLDFVYNATLRCDREAINLSDDVKQILGVCAK